MSGMSRHTGEAIDDDAHLAQSIADILTTPLGSRVMRRDYGSRLPDLIDAPMNGETLVDVFAATAEAIDRWEPRLILTRVQVTSVTPGGQMALRLDGRARSGEVGIDAVVGARA